MQKAYQRVNWENYPSPATPLGESNLLPMDAAIDEIDNRVVEHDAEIQQLFQSVSNGKILIASAITDKGVPTDATATFAVMAANIEQIEGGGGDSGLINKEFSDTFQPITFGGFIATFTDTATHEERSTLPTTGRHGYKVESTSVNSTYKVKVTSFIDGWLTDNIEMNSSSYSGTWESFDNLIRVGFNVGGGSPNWTLEILGDIEGYTVGQKINWPNTAWQNLLLVELEE